MAAHDVNPLLRGINPLPCTISSIACAALHVDHDAELGLVAVSCAAEPGLRVLLAPEIALDLALRLCGAVSALRQHEGAA